MITSIPVLTPEQCNETLEGIHRLRPKWVRRHPMAPFFTLGNPSYLDGATPPSKDYLQACEQGNLLLRQTFSSLYDHLESILADHLKTQVAPAAQTALPGFHIFRAHKAFTRPVASLHLDLQYQKIHWPHPGFYETSRPLSFTLTLSLPASGGGLSWWDLKEETLLPLSKTELRECIAQSPVHFFPYSVGNLALHSGHMLHQIAPSPRMEKGESRITLQGHGLRGEDGILYYYW